MCIHNTIKRKSDEFFVHAKQMHKFEQNIFGQKTIQPAIYQNTTVKYRIILFGLGAKVRYVAYSASLFHPQEGKCGCYHQSQACLGYLKSHVGHLGLWSVFCKSAVNNVTLINNIIQEGLKQKI